MLILQHRILFYVPKNVINDTGNTYAMIKSSLALSLLSHVSPLNYPMKNTFLYPKLKGLLACC